MNEDGRNLRERIRRARDWLMEPRTIRIVGPASLLLGVALVVVGLVVIPSVGDDPDASLSGESGTTPTTGSEGITVGGTAFPVPPDVVEGVSYLVPPRQPWADFTIAIDRLGVEARVVILGTDDNAVPQVPNHAAKVAWYDFSARPATGGNAVLAGHVRWAGDHGIFYRLDELDQGDSVRIKWDDGGESLYEVVSNAEVDPSDPASLRVMAPSDEDLLTLITCAGTFIPDADSPLGGDFTMRIIVQARLVESSVAAAGG